jgi:arylsulfatase A-like enzyme
MGGRRLRGRAARWLGALATLGSAAVIGAAAVGVLEGSAMAMVWTGARSDGFQAWAASSALAAAAVLPVFLVLLAAVAGAGRLRLVADWRRAFSAGGAERAVLLWRAALAVTGTLLVAISTFRLAAFTYQHYPAREAALFGSFIAVGVAAISALVVFAAIAADRQLGPRVRVSPRAARAADHCSFLFALLLLAGLAVAVPHALLDTARPALHPAVSLGLCLVPLLTLALRFSRVGTRRRARATAAVLSLAIAAGLAAVPSSAAARLRVTSLGLASRAAMSALLRSPFADRDGDDYPALSMGGADCDDERAAVSPVATDIAGNGIDENCTGADADPAAIAERLAPRPTSDPTAARHNILLISIDAVRADHTGAWGYRRPTTPHLDRLAAHATRFAWTFTSVPTTRPAITSLLTGRHPSTLQWVRRERLRWKESGAVGLAEALGAAGYDTAAVACCERFERAENELSGFAMIDASPVGRLAASPGEANSDAVARAAVRWLRRRRPDRPFFLWMHFIDPHAPYQVPPGGRRFGDRTMDLYDAEIHFADRSLGTVLAALDELALDSSTIVAVVSDHGEEFAEHGGRFHSRTLYNQVARIVFLLRAPGGAPRVVDTPVSIVDVMPTLLDLVGVDGPGGMNGRSLAAAVRGADLPPRPVLMEVYPMENIERDLSAVVDGGWKLVWDREANAWSLFSLADADDRDDRAAAEPARLAAMRSRLLDAVDRELGTAPPQARRPRARASR